LIKRNSNYGNVVKRREEVMEEKGKGREGESMRPYVTF